MCDLPAGLGDDHAVSVKDRDLVELVDLPCFGRSTMSAWRRIRWQCGATQLDFSDVDTDRRSAL